MSKPHLKPAFLADDAERYRKILETSNDAFVSMNESGHITEWNRKAEEVFGWEPQQVLGKTVAEVLIPERLQEAHWRGLESFLIAGTGPVLEKPIEVWALRRDGTEIPVELTIWVLREASAYSFHAFIRDVSGRKDAVARLQHALEDADRSSRDKGAFIAHMAHELRAPLTAVDGFIQLLDSTELSEEARDYVKEISNAADSILEMIDGILDAAKIEAGHVGLNIEDVDLPALVSGAVALASPLASQNEVVIDWAPPKKEHCIVRADRVRLRQVLLNLLTNGVKFNRAEGTVTVKVSETRDIARVEVRDTGFGISAEKIDDLFVPFNRLDADERGIPGTGLGLSVAKSFVEAMDGDISVESRAGKGSTFAVSLPLAKPRRRRLRSVSS